MIATEGASALWKGVVPTATGMMFENIVAFGVNAELKRRNKSTLEPVYTGGDKPGRNYLVLEEDLLRPMMIGFGE
jgi:hypothetical protein